MPDETKYNLTLIYDEILLIKEVFDYEIEEAHDIMGNEPLDEDERKEWRNYLNSLIALNRKLDSIERKLTAPVLKAELSEPSNPEFLEIV